ncbi:MAG: CpsD/CapB family tyrosine-protein kinase [Dehalobacter sp. 4CP]|uniref:CpsD/CapB family tyrosine-protein kinase n=1 Tax=Dehalobacter sp. CP TaxID=2594474 RepID=UPI0013CD7EB0|nr:CpsD/CapB family tyrosine-protein kinase [Dehalobacter sp. 4CP]
MQIKTFNVYDNDNNAVRDAYEMLTAGLLINNNGRSKTFALLSCKPEEGKTSLAISLSISIARSGWRVLFVDADMRKPTAAKRLNAEAQLGLSDYLEGRGRLEEVISNTNIPNLTYLSCGTDCSNPIEKLCAVRFQKLFEQVKIEYDYIIFDTPALESVFDGAIVASKADATMLIVKAGFTSKKSLQRAKEQLHGVNAKLIGIVLNKVKKRDYKRYYSSYNYFFNSNRFLKKAKKHFRSLNKGISKDTAKV